MFAAPQLRVGQPLAHNRLAVFPLFPDRSGSAGYRLSGDALADGTAVVEEVNEGGTVPHLSVDNRGDTLVLFLEGEELRGAKQNRVLNTSVLIPAKARTVLPVSCVEQGRWRYTSKHFSSSGMHSSSKMRSVLKKSVNASTLSGGGHSSDQGEVWGEVSRQMAACGSSSQTMAMADCYDSHADTLRQHVENVPYAEGATGMAVVVGGKLVAVDVFDAPETCRKVWSRLLTGVVMDAVESQETATPDPGAVQEALGTFAAGPWEPVKPVAAGEEYRGDVGGKWHGSVLALDGAVVHASLVLAG
jgi:hypothetical protein